IVSLDAAFATPTRDYNYPESVPGVIGVGAVQVAGDYPPYDHLQSSQNESVLVAGPSNEIDEPVAHGQMQSVDGPESAAAVVAGVAALVKSAFPHLSPALVGQAMARSARYRPAGGYNTTLGFGFVDPDGALREAARLSRPAPARVVTGQAATATFRSGPPLPAIEAVHHSRATLAAFGAAMVAGLLCLTGAPVLWWRRSRRGAASSDQLAQPLDRQRRDAG
ncbi:MAG TPA: S8 family serine peptidase, partial [Streptosporangiaceae bacterium]